MVDSPHLNDLSSTVKLALLEQNVNQHSIALNKFDEAIGRISELCTNIDKLLLQHNDRLRSQELEKDKVYSMLERFQQSQETMRVQYENITTKVTTLSNNVDALRISIEKMEKMSQDKFEEYDKKISLLDKWKWGLAGALSILMLFYPSLKTALTTLITTL